MSRRKKPARDLFACPGCGKQGTPEETRDGCYVVICKSPETCSYAATWLVPIPRGKARDPK